METFEYRPQGYFNLLNQAQYFQQCAAVACHKEKVVLAYPVEGCANAYATTIVTQPQPGLVRLEVNASPEVVENAYRQALAVFSLDVDASGWGSLGEKDPVIAQLQRKYDFVRPGLFYSPYEAAVSFIIGNRISIRQRQQLMQQIARELGNESKVDGQTYYAFPSPEVIMEASHLPGVNELKLKRLKTIARAAAQGWLTRGHLLSMPVEMALQQIKNLEGVGEFYAQAILHRGAGIVNELTLDDISEYALQQAYGGGKPLSAAAVKKITANWEPYKMWCNVLLHIWIRTEIGLPQKRTFVQKSRQPG